DWSSDVCSSDLAATADARPSPRHHASASATTSPGTDPPASSARTVSMTGVTGWCSANPRRQVGTVSTGTNALDTYGRNITPNVNPLAASGDRTSTPTRAASQVNQPTNRRITPTAATHSSAAASGRKPMRIDTPNTIAVETRFFTRLATTCPVSTVHAATGIDRSRSTMPPDMSRSTASAVLAAPNPAASRMTPGVT